jgi:hypothetical protein
MKKFFIIAGMILAVMMVVQPSYAATKHFNINVTVSEFSMELLRLDGTQYMDWPVTVPPSHVLTMAAQDAVMISLTGDLPNSVDIFVSVDNDDGWIPIMPDMMPLQNNDFMLEVSGMQTVPVEPVADAGFMAITQDTMAPTMNIPTNGLQQAEAYLLYKLHVGQNYTHPDAQLDVKIKANPIP